MNMAVFLPVTLTHKGEKCGKCSGTERQRKSRQKGSSDDSVKDMMAAVRTPEETKSSLYWKNFLPRNKVFTLL